MANDDSGAQPSAGQGCPALKSICGKNGEAGPAEGERRDGDIAPTAEESAAIIRFLKERRAGGGRAYAVILAALKGVGVALVSGGLVAGYLDGDDMDDVGCTVAQQPGGPSQGAHSVKAKEPGGGKLPGSGGGPDGGAGDGGDPPPPPCVALAEQCGCRLPDGNCGKRGVQCWAVEWEARVQSDPGGVPPCKVQNAEVAKLLAGIHQEIAAVRADFVELRSAKERLQKMLGDGLFAFTQKVDAASFKVLCTILAEGDVAKASRRLGMLDTTVRALMRRWRRMGKEYSAMLDLVRWRKAVGRKETVALNDNVLLEKADRADYPGLIADVLEKVTEMTGENWRGKAGELEEMLRAAVHR